MESPPTTEGMWKRIVLAMAMATAAAAISLILLERQDVWRLFWPGVILCAMSLKFLWQVAAHGHGIIGYAILDRDASRAFKIFFIACVLAIWTLGFLLLIPGVGRLIL